jgi:hypothetical protein
MCSSYWIDYFMILGIDEETRLFSTRTTTMPFLSEKELTASNMFYFEMLHINPIKANISFVTTPKIINPNVYFFILFYNNIHTCFSLSLSLSLSITVTQSFIQTMRISFEL